MQADIGTGHELGREIVDRIEALLLDAEETTKPPEVDPHRTQLFELFVTADAAGFIDEDSDPDLTADGVSRELALRWGLATAAQMSVQRQAKLPPEHLSRMRLLWSFMRMWMEWAYAWQRWGEFHGPDTDRGRDGGQSSGGARPDGDS